MPDDREALAHARWRLVLGRFAEPALGPCRPAPAGSGPNADHARIDRALDYLYGREYAGRGVRHSGPPSSPDSGYEHEGYDEDENGRGGGQESSRFTIPGWLEEVLVLFPRVTAEVLERHALDRYGMTGLVTDPEVLRRLEPSFELLRAILAFRHLMGPPVAEVARGVAARVVADVRRRLEADVRRVILGRLTRARSARRIARNLDWHRTIRANLRHYDPDRRRLAVRSLVFAARAERRIPWHVILAVDCSGSMVDSVIHAAVLAGIFAGLPALRVSLVAFDTAVVDLSGEVDDPVALLMSVQLGGGTDIAGALGYCADLVAAPDRSVVVVVTDFVEGGPPDALPAAVRRLRESGARVLGLAALDEGAVPSYDRAMAARCVAAGAEVAALTPGGLAEWLARVLS